MYHIARIAMTKGVRMDAEPTPAPQAKPPTRISSPINPVRVRAVARVAELSGENISKCMQCGTCSAVCPMIESMGFTTRQGILYLQFGRVEEVADARIGEYCASCHACQVRCPRGIEVPKVFEAVRLLTLRKNEDFIKLRDIPKNTLEEAPQIALVSSFRKLTA
jgi:heterodisulfide reductase subunit C